MVIPKSTLTLYISFISLAKLKFKDDIRIYRNTRVTLYEAQIQTRYNTDTSTLLIVICSVSGRCVRATLVTLHISSPRGEKGNLIDPTDLG